MEDQARREGERRAPEQRHQQIEFERQSISVEEQRPLEQGRLRTAIRKEFCLKEFCLRITSALQSSGNNPKRQTCPPSRPAGGPARSGRSTHLGHGIGDREEEMTHGCLLIDKHVEIILDDVTR